MNQTRFYIVENSKSIVRVNLFVGGLPPQLSPEEYTNILKDELAVKSKWTGAFSNIFACAD